MNKLVDAFLNQEHTIFKELHWHCSFWLSITKTTKPSDVCNFRIQNWPKLNRYSQLTAGIQSLANGSLLLAEPKNWIFLNVNCKTISFVDRLEFQNFPLHSIFLLFFSSSVKFSRPAVVGIWVCVCKFYFSATKIIMKSKKKNTPKKRKNNNCACFESIYESVFITCSYYEILAANLSLCIIFSLSLSRFICMC